MHEDLYSNNNCITVNYTLHRLNSIDINSLLNKF